jgi:hypothetical protein
MAEIAQISGRSNAPTAQAANVAAIAAWHASPVHRTHLLGPGWRFAGVAIVGEIALVVFADKCTAAGCTKGSGRGVLLDGGGATAPPGTSGGAGSATETAAGATRTSTEPPGGAERSLACTGSIRTRLLRRSRARCRSRSGCPAAVPAEATSRGSTPARASAPRGCARRARS